LVLILFVVVLALGVPHRLAGSAWPYRAPGLGILAWHGLSYAVVIAVALAAGATFLRWEPGRDDGCTMWELCVDTLQGSHGRLAQAAAWAGVAALTALVARLLIGWGRMATAVMRARQHQLMLLRVAGQARVDLGVTVLPEATPAAYVVPGHQSHVVITSGALARLDAHELAAVLAHERAHERGHHHELRTTVRLLRRAFPGVPAFVQAAYQVDRLVELCADQYAARECGALPLARALVNMARLDPDTDCVGGKTAMAATGGDVAERLRRMLDPPPPLGAPVRVVAAVGWALLPGVPVLIVLAGHLLHQIGT
jgi:Zn-dependent protease with chaperone function